MSDPDPGRRRLTARPPAQGWALGAGGIPAGFWAGLASVLAAVGIVLLATDYTGYGLLLLVLGLAAAVNLIP